MAFLNAVFIVASCLPRPRLQCIGIAIFAACGCSTSWTWWHRYDNDECTKWAPCRFGHYLGIRFYGLKQCLYLLALFFWVSHFGCDATNWLRSHVSLQKLSPAARRLLGVSSAALVFAFFFARSLVATPAFRFLQEHCAPDPCPVECTLFRYWEFWNFRETVAR